jgi:acetyltransferase-like isoleucine patch superfamily enzyme
MKIFLINLYNRIRKTEVSLDEFSSTPLDLIIGLALRKATSLIRGFLTWHPFLFRGLRVRLHGLRYLKLGKLVSLGEGVRISAFSINGCIIGDYVTIDDFAVLKCSGAIRETGIGIKIGSRTSIGLRNYIHGGGGVTIGTDCLLGPDVKIISANHNIVNFSQAFRIQPDNPAEIFIGDNVWIGANSVILAGVTIGSNSVIAAGSIVNKNVQESTLVAGVPAKVVRKLI